MRRALALGILCLAVSASAQPDAGELEQRLGRAYSVLPELAEVRVRESDGVVVLEGKTSSPKARGTAEEIAKKLPGVLHVENRIEVPEQPATATPEPTRTEKDQVIAERLRGVFSHVDDLEKVKVGVSSGVVRLEGTTASTEAREKAEKLAAKMEGVVYVDNDIEEATEVGERVSPALQRLQTLGRKLGARAPLYGVALAVVAVFFFLGRAVSRSDKVVAPFVRHRMMRGIARQFVATVIIVIGIVAALELVEATSLVGAVLGAAGVAGIAIGFAFRDIVENYLASLLLGLRRPFEPNDLVLVGEHEGKVVRLTTRETILMSLDGNHVRLPNAQVFKSVIVNFTKNPLRRLAFKAGVGVEENLVDAQRVGVDALRATPGVVEDPGPFTRIEELGDSTVVVQYFAWVDQRTADWYKVKSEAIRRVKAALDAEGIALPVPTYRLESDAQARAPESGRQELEQAGHEVQPDDVLDKQIREDAEREPEENLLEEPKPDR